MISDKIGKLISELDTVTGMLIVASMTDKTVRQAMEKVINVSVELGNLIDYIETEKAIENCRLRQLAILEETDVCGVDENGRCLGYKEEECRECIYCVHYEEEE